MDSLEVLSSKGAGHAGGGHAAQPAGMRHLHGQTGPQGHVTAWYGSQTTQTAWPCDPMVQFWRIIAVPMTEGYA